MIIVGIDPGSIKTGYAVLEHRNGQWSLLQHGVWNLKSAKTPALGDRLEELYLKVTEFFKAWNPAVIGFEYAVTFKNPSSSLKLSEARGVIRLAAHQNLEQAEDRFFELSPTAVKKHASELGGASKGQVRQVLKMRFKGLQDDLPSDAFDAVAIAFAAGLAHARKRLVQKRDEANAEGRSKGAAESTDNLTDDAEEARLKINDGDEDESSPIV